MSQEVRNIKWNGRPPVIEVGEPVRFSLDGQDVAGTITAVKGRTVREDGLVTDRGQVTFTYEDDGGVQLSHTAVGPK